MEINLRNASKDDNELTKGINGINALLNDNWNIALLAFRVRTNLFDQIPTKHRRNYGKTIYQNELRRKIKQSSERTEWDNARTWLVSATSRRTGG